MIVLQENIIQIIQIRFLIYFISNIVRVASERIC